VAAIAAEEKVSSRPAKGSVAPAGQYSYDDFPPLNDDGFPPISGNPEQVPPQAPEPDPSDVPSPIEMSILPAEGAGEEKSDKISHSKRRSSFTRHRSRERQSGSDKDSEDKKDKKDKSDKIGAASSSKRRSKPKLRGSDERTNK